MELDYKKIDDTILALLHLTSFKDQGVTRAWKGHNWDALSRLYEAGLLRDPRNKAKSVILTNEGARRASELFEKLFQVPK
jgi:hypothetical protein